MAPSSVIAASHSAAGKDGEYSGCARIDTRYAGDKHVRTRTDIATTTRFQLDVSSSSPPSSSSPVRFSPENISKHTYLPTIRIRSSMEQFHWPTVRRESFVAGFVALSIFFRLVPRLFWKVGIYVFAVHAYVLKGHPCVPVAFRVDSARGIVASRDFPIRDLIFFPTISSQYSLLLRSRTRIFQSLRIRERHEVGNGSREFLLTILSKFTCTYVRVYVRRSKKTHGYVKLSPVTLNSTA